MKREFLFNHSMLASLLIAFAILQGCVKKDFENKKHSGPDMNGNKLSTMSITPNPDSKYIVFFLTNTTVAQAGGPSTGKDATPGYTFVSELPYLFGNIQASDKVKYAFGLSGPMLLTQSVQQMQDQVNDAFDLAEAHNVPVYFQLDDMTDYTTAFGSGASPKFYNNPAWCEWIAFPTGGQTWGGQQHGRLPYWWFNWGAWQHTEAVPNFESPGFKAFVKSQLENGVLSVLTTRYNALKAQGKGYLFAGMAIGWETHIPDYSSDNTVMNINPNNLPVEQSTGHQMQSWEAGKYGYAALHSRGYASYNREVLYDVIHDYSEFLSKIVHDAGIERHKIYTHIIGMESDQPNLHTTFAPPIWAAVNDYSIPGFTMSPITCPYNVGTLKSEIIAADANQPYFGNVEGYARGVDGSFAEADNYFSELFGNGALNVSVFGWGRESASSPFAVSHSPTSPFVMAAEKWIRNNAKNWDFESSVEGWTIGNHMSSLGWRNDGGLKGNLSGSDAYVVSPLNPGYTLNAQKKITIRIKNQSAFTGGQIYFTTTSSTGWSETKRKNFTMDAYSDFTTYTIDMSDVPTWTGTLRQLRIDACNGGSSGSFTIDYLYVGTQGWHFASNITGWTAGSHVQGLTWQQTGGQYIGGHLSGTDAFILSPDNLNIPASGSKYVSVRLKNNTANTNGQIYFTTTSSTGWSGTKQISFPIEAYSGWVNYTVDMSTLSTWTGTLKRLRVDAANGSSASGTFEVEHVYISK